MSALQILNTEIRTLDNLYSLNDLHKTAGEAKKHQPNRFLRLDQTKELITEIERSTDVQIETPKNRSMCLDSSGYPDMGTAIKTQRGGAYSGTYACKEIVYAYAMWISPKFNLQVIRSFDQQMQNELVSQTNKLPELPETITPAQQCHLKDRIGELVRSLTGNSWQLQYTKLNRFMGVGQFTQILEVDYAKACRFLNCAPKSELNSALLSVDKFERDKYALLNSMVAQMNLSDDPVIVPKKDLKNTVIYVRHVQSTASRLVSACGNIDTCIEGLKSMTGCDLGDIH
jgi:hypothetical protein